MNINLNSVTVAFDYSSGQNADIKRCLETLYGTVAGTCPLDRNFGLNQSMIGMPLNVAQNEFALEIIEKTEKYEPRAKVKDITFGLNDEGGMDAQVIITNNS